MVYELKISFSKNTPTVMINILDKHDSERPSRKCVTNGGT